MAHEMTHPRPAVRAHREHRRRTDAHSAVPAATRSQRVIRISAGDDHRPQAVGHHVHRHLGRLLHGRRIDGAADALRAWRARSAVLVQRAVQPAVHHARHDHAAAVCHPDRVRLRQLHSAASDWRARRGVPAAECAQLLAVSVRRADHRLRVPHPGRRGRLRLDGLHARSATPCIPRAPAPICGSWAWPSPVWAPSWVRST